MGSAAGGCVRAKPSPWQPHPLHRATTALAIKRLASMTPPPFFAFGPAAIIRQITASVTFLPLIDEPCSFDLLVYADEDVDVPRTWEDSDPR